MKKLALVLLTLATLLSLCACGTRKGDTSHCTICGSSNIFYSSDNYGYCEEHFNDMINYGN